MPGNVVYDRDSSAHAEKNNKNAAEEKASINANNDFTERRKDFDKDDYADDMIGVVNKIVNSVNVKQVDGSPAEEVEVESFKPIEDIYETDRIKKSDR